MDRYTNNELMKRTRIIEFFEGTEERFRDPSNFEQKAKDFVDNLFESCSFEDEEMIKTVVNAYFTLRNTLSTTIGTDNYAFYKFLKLIDGFFATEYRKLIQKFYR